MKTSKVTGKQGLIWVPRVSGECVPGRSCPRGGSAEQWGAGLNTWATTSPPINSCPPPALPLRLWYGRHCPPKRGPSWAPSAPCKSPSEPFLFKTSSNQSLSAGHVRGCPPQQPAGAGRQRHERCPRPRRGSGALVAGRCLRPASHEPHGPATGGCADPERAPLRGAASPLHPQTTTDGLVPKVTAHTVLAACQRPFPGPCAFTSFSPRARLLGQPGSDSRLQMKNPGAAFRSRPAAEAVLTATRATSHTSSRRPDVAPCPLPRNPPLSWRRTPEREGPGCGPTVQSPPASQCACEGRPPGGQRPRRLAAQGPAGTVALASLLGPLASRRHTPLPSGLPGARHESRVGAQDRHQRELERKKAVTCATASDTRTGAGWPRCHQRSKDLTCPTPGRAAGASLAVSPQAPDQGPRP